MSHRRIALVPAFALAGLAARAVAQETAWSAQGISADHIGLSLAFVGDVDGDGISDLLVGGAGFNYSNSLVRLLSGADGSTIRTDTLNETVPNVAALGDVDGDGVPDLLLGIAEHVENGKMTGVVVVHSGASGVELLRLFGDDDSDLLGSSVGGLGDVDGDGVPDFFAGALCNVTSKGKAGYVRVFSGATGATLYDVKGTTVGEEFGVSGASLSDLDGDGVRDFVVGARQVSTTPGYLRIVSGANGATLRTIVVTNSANFGSIVANAGDVDGDGSDDVIALDTDFSAGFFQNFGAAFVFSGATGTEIRRHLATQAEPFKFTAAGAGDVDGDGFADYAVSTFVFTFTGNPFDIIGQARLYSGKTGLSLYRFRPASVNTYFGMALAGGVDFDGDGRSELAIGAPYDTGGGAGAGRVDVFLGNDLYLDAEPDVASAGDTVALTTRVGVPGNVTIDALIDVNGTPVFVLLDGLATFDATGTHALSGTVPAGLAGTTFTLWAAAIDANGHVVRSATESLAFQ